MELRFAPLFSGSSGNAIYVGCGDTHLLVDAGLSGTRVINGLEKIGVHPSMLSAVLTTHEHVDHVKGVGILSRKFHLPVYATEGTWDGMADKIGNVEAENRCYLVPDQDFYMGAINVMPLYSYVAAVSVGIVNDEAVCDLDYVEDSGGEVDFNFIMDDEGNIIELQGTGEERPFSKKELDEMYVLAQGGIKQLVAAQKAVVGHLFR